MNRSFVHIHTHTHKHAQTQERTHIHTRNSRSENEHILGKTIPLKHTRTLGHRLMPG